MQKNKNFYIKKSKNLTVDDFTPQNRKKIIKDIRVISSKNPTTPGWKAERYRELRAMTDQIQETTSNADRTEKLTSKQECYDYYSSDESDNDDAPHPT